MADVTVQQSGGDFTTLNAALTDAGRANGDKVTIQGSWTIDDTATCTVQEDDITVVAVAGNTSYHDGLYDESNNHYRLVTSSGHCITVNNIGFIVDGVAVVQSGTGSSDECVRISSTGTHTFKRCILQTTSDTSDQDGIYRTDGAITVNIENCVLYRFGRAAIHSQSVSGTHTQTWNINSCSIFDCTTFDSGGNENDGGGVGVLSSNSGLTCNVNIYNSYVMQGDVDGGSADFNEFGSTSTVTWGISFSIDSDNSIASRDGGGTGNLASRTIRTSTSGGDELLVVNITDDTQDLHLVDDATNNDAQDAHSDTAEEGLTLPTLDIDDETRDTASNKIDIGADAFPASGAQTITAPVLKLTLTLPTETITATGSASLIAPVRRLTLNLPTESIAATGSAPITALVLRLNATLPIQSIGGTGSAPITAPVRGLLLTLPGQTVSPTGSASIGAPVRGLILTLPLQAISTPGGQSILAPVLRLDLTLPIQSIVGTGSAPITAPIVGLVLTLPVTSLTTLSTQPTLESIMTMAQATTLIVETNTALENAVTKLLASVGCLNIYTIDIPPIRTEHELVQWLRVERGGIDIHPPAYEAWFFGRLAVGTNSRNRGTNQQWQQIDGLRIVGLAWYDTFLRSYQFIQEQGDLVVATLKKNIDLLMGSEVDTIRGLEVRYGFEDFADQGLHRVEIRFETLGLQTGDLRVVTNT